MRCEGGLKNGYINQPLRASHIGNVCQHLTGEGRIAFQPQQLRGLYSRILIGAIYQPQEQMRRLAARQFRQPIDQLLVGLDTETDALPAHQLGIVSLNALVTGNGFKTA